MRLPFLTKTNSQQNIRRFCDGEIVFRQNDEGRDMFIVQTGGISLTREVSGQVVEVATLHKGDFVGEMALLESLPRTATAKAIGTTSLLCISPGGFLLKIRRDPTFAFEMLQNLSRRIRITSDRLIEVTHKKSLSQSIIQSVLQSVEFNQKE